MRSIDSAGYGSDLIFVDEALLREQSNERRDDQLHLLSLSTEACKFFVLALIVVSTLAKTLAEDLNVALHVSDVESIPDIT